MCYLPPAPALWMCLGALVGQGDLHRLQRRALVMGRQVTVCANPFLFREPCQPAGVLGLSVVPANRNNGCSRGARCARLIIESRLLSNPRLAQWGKPSCRPHPREFAWGG
jgi:hypothetical protein